MRKVNGILSLALALLVAAHALLGIKPSGQTALQVLQALGWAAVFFALGHALLSIGTSRQMLTDTNRPPSKAKKRHLVLKWATGILLAALVAFHVAAGAGVVPSPIEHFTKATVVAVAAVMGTHVYVGTRSLLKDIGLPRAWKSAARALVAACTIAACAALVVLI